MPPSRIRPRLAGTIALALAFAVLNGCAVTEDDPPESTSSREADPTPSPTETPTPTPTPTPTATPTVTATVTTPAPSPSVAPPTASGPEAALLAAPELPGLNDGYRWTEQRTGPAGPEPFGLCQKFDLNTIGATDTRERVFTGDGGSAGQQIADFADPQTAVRASKVVEAWHKDCRGRVRGRNVKVRPLSDVAVGSGRAWHYLVSFTRRGEGNFEGLGMAVSGTRLTLIRMAHTGEDHNYDDGQDPMERAVQAAASKFGR